MRVRCGGVQSARSEAFDLDATILVLAGQGWRSSGTAGPIQTMMPKFMPGVKPKVKADRPIGEWNTSHIFMKCDRLTVTVNNKLTVKDAQLPGLPWQ